jgi:hypothetical protein
MHPFGTSTGLKITFERIIKTLASLHLISAKMDGINMSHPARGLSCASTEHDVHLGRQNTVQYSQTDKPLENLTYMALSSSKMHEDVIPRIRSNNDNNHD